MTSMQPEGENFRNHIQQLLFHYAKAHLTVDYVQWTESAVAELLLQCLREVPVDDPTSLWIPQDPFDTLKHRFKFSYDLSAFEERWQTNPHALMLVKDSLVSIPGRSRTDKAPFFDDYDLHSSGRMTPVLTRRAVRRTHKFPSCPEAIFTKKAPFLIDEGIKAIENKDLEEIPPHPEKILNVNWVINSSIHQAVRALLKETLNLPQRVPPRHGEWLFSGGDDNGWDSSLNQLHSPFVPLFPRKCRPGHKPTNDIATGKGPGSFAELPTYLLPQIPTKNMEMEFFNDCMRVIDDWGASPISSPSTLATLTSSQGDRKIDRLFIGSSPNTDHHHHHTEALEAAKMETVQIPRSRRLGGALKQTSITGDHGFTSFILDRLSGTGKLKMGDPSTCDTFPECVSSLDGQVSCPAMDEASATLYGEDDDNTLRKIYAAVDPKDIWLGERLDEKNMMLMEVPTLPPPNVHSPGALYLPSRFNDFVPASGGRDGNPAVHRFLKKVKGLQPLQVTLSWMAFTTKHPLPTTTQIIGVSCCFEEPELLMNGISIGAVKEMINYTILDSMTDTAAGPMTMSISEESFGTAFARLAYYGPEMVLTRRERRRGAGDLSSQLEQDAFGSDGEVNKSVAETNFLRNEKHESSQTCQPNQLPGICCANRTSTALPFQELKRNNDQLKEKSVKKDSLSTPFGPEDAHATTIIPRTVDDIPAGGGISPHANNPASRPTAAWHEANVTAYAKLRLRTVTAPSTLPGSPVHCPGTANKADANNGRSSDVPANILDRTTLQLPPQMKEATNLHRYMASINLLQRKMLIRALRTPKYSVELVERDDLDGVDLIVDPFTGVIYASLFSLPSQCEDLIDRISKLSWSYQRLVVVLEGYTPICANKAVDETPDMPSAYTPPILKAIKKLRRGVGLAEAVEEKPGTTIVLYAFVNSIYEAASITRYIGDVAEEVDMTNGTLWDDRLWLDEPNEDEKNLSKASGMNTFSAAVILTQVTLDDFIMMTAEERERMFAPYVGPQVIASFNADLQRRIEVTQSSDFIEEGEILPADESGTMSDYDMY